MHNDKFSYELSDNYDNKGKAYIFISIEFQRNTQKRKKLHSYLDILNAIRYKTPFLLFIISTKYLNCLIMISSCILY